MSTAYDHRTSDEDVPGWTDDESPTPVDPEGEHEETPSRPRCWLCRAILSEDGTCAPCVVRQAEIEASRTASERSAEEPCVECGRARGVGHVLGRCIACRMLAKIKAEEEERRRQLESSPHACACGVKLWRPGRCSTCAETHREEQLRRDMARTALETVPVALQQARFDAKELRSWVKDHAALERVRQAVKDGVKRFLLVGPTAIGKSTAAVCIQQAYCYARCAEGAFVDCFTLALARQNARLGEEPAAVVDAIETPIVILDELGAERPVPTSPVGEVIWHRHARDLTTIVTSGFSLAQLEERYGAGIFRRLVEGAEVIEFRPAKGGPW